MHIKNLQLFNFQVIKELNADFEGNVYFITGDNELGKSTLLKAIGALLTGERDAVLKNGEKNGFAKMVVGNDGANYEVELKFTEKNPRGTLSIKTADGMKSDNVSMLQKLFGYTNFDAVEFASWSETAEGRRKQVECIKALLPKEVQERINAIDSEITRIKYLRKEDSASLKTYETIFNNSQNELSTLLKEQKENGFSGNLKDYPSPIGVAELLQEQQTNASLIEKAKTVKQAKAQREEQLKAIPERVEELGKYYNDKLLDIEAEMVAATEEYEKVCNEAKQKFLYAQKLSITKKEQIALDKVRDLERVEAERLDFETRLANANKWLADYEKQNPENQDTTQKLKDAEKHNLVWTKAKEVDEKKGQMHEYQEKVYVHETKIADLFNERVQLIKDNSLPIEGLSFSDEGLYLNNVPFMPGHVSDSQIIEVATNLIIASNPTVKVFRIARGESLGQQRLNTIIEVAKKNGFQGFIEQVERGQTDLKIEEYTEPN